MTINLTIVLPFFNIFNCNDEFLDLEFDLDLYDKDFNLEEIGEYNGLEGTSCKRLNAFTD